jgi:hypothetical protein
MQLFRHLDQLLRGEFTRADDLRDGRVPVPSRWLVGASLICGGIYGLCMGLYAASGDIQGGMSQFVSSTLKVPLLFLLTLLVTFPSLYVFGALGGSRLRMQDMLRLLVGTITVNLAVVASFGPVIVFFTVFTTSHAFISLLNVVFFALSGAVSLGFLSRATRVVFDRGPQAQVESAADPASASPAESAATARPQNRARLIFRLWILIYGVVGAQMGWVLRPFVGNPNLEFVWFRHQRESSFFAALLDLLRDVTGSW